MCGRFALTLPTDAMAQLFAAVPSNDLPDVPNFNICPTDRVHAVVSQQGRRLQALRWGFVPHWAGSPNEGPPLINARAETIADKPVFRKSVRARRCLIPADGFFEWTAGSDGKRLPWFIVRTDRAPMVFAGVWQDWVGTGRNVRSCAIVTCAASGDIARLHGRLPVILDPCDWAMWLGEEGVGAARLMVATEALRAWRVGPAINSNTAEGPALVAPLE